MFTNQPGPDTYGVILAGLTPAERLVVAHVRQGLSNKEIAATLGKAEATIKNQVAACLRKFNQPSRSRLIVYLFEQG